VIAEGPYFDELHVGQVFPAASAVTLTDGLGAMHQAIVGDRLALALDSSLAVDVVGSERPLAHPALVWDVAIGQSTGATHHVKANLFYRGLTFSRAPTVGDTLHTTTRVDGLRRNRVREGRAATGLAALRITTVDQHDRPVLDFWRCAMLPLRDPAAETGPADDLDHLGAGADIDNTSAAFVHTWRLDEFRRRRPGQHFADLRAGETIEVVGGDVVSSGPELARLTLNMAQVHHDATAGGGARLVYGGHTIGIALSQVSRALPGLVTVLGWHGCDHVGPVREGDTLRSTVEIERLEPRPGGGGLAHLRSLVTADPDRPVLDWRFVALFA
jgi:acyl dehydratase